MQTFIHLTSSDMSTIIELLQQTKSKKNTRLGRKMLKIMGDAIERGEQFHIAGEDDPDDEDEDEFFDDEDVDDDAGYDYVEEGQEPDDAFDDLIGMPRD